MDNRHKEASEFDSEGFEGRHRCRDDCGLRFLNVNHAGIDVSRYSGMLLRRGELESVLLCRSLLIYMFSYMIFSFVCLLETKSLTH